MSTITINTATEINQLHADIEQRLQRSLTDAIRIGELLVETKQELPHGEFTGWIEDNLSFSPRTARRYQKLYSNQDQLTGVSSINGAYNLLNGKTDTVSDLGLADHLKFETIMAMGQDYIMLLREHGRSFEDLYIRFFNGVVDYHKRTDDILEWANEPSKNCEEREEKLRTLSSLKNEQDALHDLVSEIRLRHERKIGESLNEYQAQL